ncbi:MAG: hypothetical protein HQL53_09975 [Magnetococcales bacterium]|nr:hypothetical protein [Magnetococcales bacterium]
MPLQSGDTLVVHTSWENLARLEDDRNYVVVTSEYPKEELRPHKVVHAGIATSPSAPVPNGEDGTPLLLRLELQENELDPIVASMAWESCPSTC